MKKFRKNMDPYFDRLDEKWRALPIRKQHLYALCFFVGYLLLTAGVVFKVWYDTGKPNNDMHIEPIENPVLEKKERPANLQDTVTTIINNKTYESK